jgi:hypothetical protein
MADNKDKAQQGKQDVPDQSGVGFTADQASGAAQPGGGQNRQDAGSGQYSGGEGAGTSRQSGFIHSSPDANVFPAGSPQSDRGDAGSRAAASAAGTPDEGKLGGSGGTSASGTTGNDPDR